MDKRIWILKLLFLSYLFFSIFKLGYCDENDRIRDEEAAREFVREFDEIVGDLYNQRALAHWAYETNITQHNKQKTVSGDLLLYYDNIFEIYYRFWEHYILF